MFAEWAAHRVAQWVAHPALTVFIGVAFTLYYVDAGQIIAAIVNTIGILLYCVWQHLRAEWNRSIDLACDVLWAELNEPSWPGGGKGIPAWGGGATA